MLEINKDQHIYSFSKDNEAIAYCDSGETVVFHTSDCYSDMVKTVDYDWDKFLIRVNPSTGPLYINQAEQGDTILVRIINIELNSTGIIVSKPNNGVFGMEVKDKVTKIVKIVDNNVEFNDQIKFKVTPMIGCIGTAPIAGDIASNTPNNHGGNLDNRRIMIGSTLELPVFVDGALLALGDLHASMGDGEVNCSGIECGGKVTVQVEVLKNRRLTNPRVISNGILYTMASGIDLDMASGIACKEMLNVLMEYNRMDIYDAGMLMSAIGNLEVCQIVNPLATARFGVDLRYINYDIKDGKNGN